MAKNSRKLYKAHGKLPVTKADIKMSKKHIKSTIKLEKKKVKDHVKAAKKTTNRSSKAYNLSHAKEHQKDIKVRQKYAKKVAKLKGKK